MNLNKNKIKYFAFGLWLVFLLGSVYTYFFNNNLLQSQFFSIFGSSLALGYLVFLLAGCLRGFTLIPVTYLIVIGVFFIPSWPLYIMIIMGVLVSSVCVYYFSEYLNFDQYFETKYPERIKQIKEFLSKNELPVVAIWSFMPFLPTDLICYVCGTLKIDIRKFLLGIFIGEGVSCAIYVFVGKEILNWFI